MMKLNYKIFPIVGLVLLSACSLHAQLPAPNGGNGNGGPGGVTGLSVNGDSSVNASVALTNAPPTTPTYNAAGNTTCNFALANDCNPTNIVTSGTTLVINNPHYGANRIKWKQSGIPVTNPITYPANMSNCPQPNPVANKTTQIEFSYDGTNIWCPGSDDPTNDTPITTGELGAGVRTALDIAHDAAGGICTNGGGGCAGGSSGTLTTPASDILSTDGAGGSTNACPAGTCGLTSFATGYVINANTLITGKSYRVTATFKIITSASPPDINFAINAQKSGPTNVVLYEMSNAATGASVSGTLYATAGWVINGTAAAGASANTLSGMQYLAGYGNFAVNAFRNLITQPKTLDTTAAQTITIQILFGAATAANSVQLLSFLVEPTS